MRESVRGQRKIKIPDRTLWQQQPNRRTSKSQKSRPSRKIRMHADTTVILSPDRRGDSKVEEKRKLKRRKIEHIEHSCLAVSCYVKKVVGAKKEEKNKKEERKINLGKLAHTNLNPLEEFRNPPTIPTPLCPPRGQIAVTRACSQTHKPQFTFNLRSAKLQFPGRSTAISSTMYSSFKRVVFNLKL